MTTAIQITDYNTIEEKVGFNYPLTASEAFNFGINMLKMLASIYQELNKCEKKSARNTIQYFKRQNELELESFTDAFKFMLNAEIGEFYRNKGQVVINESLEKEVNKTKPLIKRNIENYITKIEAIHNDLEAGEYRINATSKDIYDAIMEIRYYSSELYDRLAKLYPEGEIQKAFVEMSQTISAGSKKAEANF